MAQFYGSANTGLGFFHVEVDKPAAVAWLNLDNVGIAVVDGDITMDELKQNFSEIWKTNWPWQMRQLEGNKFLVRFPPGKKIKDLVGFPSINLRKKGVSVSFTLWDGDVPCYAEMQEIWVKVEGIPPKYLSWRVMMRVATALGIPIDVDWHEIFRSFYRVLRLRVVVRDITKVPSSRVMEFGGKLYLLNLSIVPEVGVMTTMTMEMILGMVKMVAMLKRTRMWSIIWREVDPWILINRVTVLLLLHLPMEVQVAKACSKL
jgi:hypothetical protein